MLFPAIVNPAIVRRFIDRYPIVGQVDFMLPCGQPNPPDLSGQVAA